MCLQLYRNNLYLVIIYKIFVNIGMLVDDYHQWLNLNLLLEGTFGESLREC